MNYRDIIKKYMEHVVTCAGSDYVDVLNDPLGSDVEFDNEEYEELRNISIELESEVTYGNTSSTSKNSLDKPSSSPLED